MQQWVEWNGAGDHLAPSLVPGEMLILPPAESAVAVAPEQKMESG